MRQTNVRLHLKKTENMRKCTVTWRQVMAVAGRSISMFSLITDDILEPGDGVLTFDYLGKRYIADLLPEGTIRGEDQIFASPYAWASHCKNQVNPDQKTAIGWGHIRYKGIKLSQYKNLYLKKNKLLSDHNMEDVGIAAPAATSEKLKSFTSKKGRKRKSDACNNLTTTSDSNPSNDDVVLPSDSVMLPSDSMVLPSDMANVVMGSAIPSVGSVSHQGALSETSELVQCGSFEELGEAQPFDVVVSSNVFLLMDYHSHLCWSEVLGYLGGHYDQTKQSLQILQAFPIYYTAKETNEENQSIEKDIKEKMKADGFSVVGWYHSHPSREASPTVNDIMQQINYQESLQIKGGVEPCVGLIVAPNLANKHSGIQSKINAFWIKKRDATYVSPLTIQYSIAWEQFLTHNIVDEMNKLSSYYRQRQDYVNFKSQWRDGIPFAHKLKTSLANVQPKFPQEHSDETFFTFIEQLVYQVQ